MNGDSPSLVRDRYHGELLAVREMCDSMGLVFTEQMRWACRGLRTVAAIDRGEEQQLDGDGRPWWPDEEELEERTPGVKLMMLARQIGTGYERKESCMDNTTNAQTGRATTIKATRLVRDKNTTPTKATAPVTIEHDRMLGCVRRSGTPPEIPARSYVHPSVAEIAALPPDQWFEVQRGTVKLDTLKRRVREANTKNKQRGSTAHCACFAQQDGTMIVRRVDPQAKGT